MHRSHRHSAFTLVELLISIGIALLLIVGVNAVFKVTAQTVNAGNSLLSANRDARTVFQTFFADLANIDAVPAAGSTSGDAPFFIIRSEHQYAFRNAADQQGATSSSNPSSQTGMFGGTIPVVVSDYRSHRIDRLGFFSRGVFARQTSSNNSQFVSTTAGNEAWIVVGHSQQPNLAMVRGTANAAWCDPGDPNPLPSGAKNDNDYFASDWMLSRVATILVPTPTSYDTPYLQDANGLTPLNGQVQTATGGIYQPATSGSYTINTARYDIAATSIAKYGSTSRADGIASYSWSPTANPGVNYGKDWWDPVIAFRFQAGPFILPSTFAAGSATKVSAQTLSSCAPDLIRGCSSFIVEYAGNFYTKNPSGANSNGIPDGTPLQPQPVPKPDPSGTIDFYRDSNGINHTRWYGYPRSTVSTTVSPTSGDVVPLRDVLESLQAGWGVYADAERFSSNFPTYAQMQGGSPPGYWSAMSATTDMASRYTYTAAWGPDVRYQAFPKMIRIIIEIDDHEGALNAPQRYEFIFDVQQ